MTGAVCDGAGPLPRWCRTDSGSDAAPTFPVLGIDHPDPDVLRVASADGRATYYMTATVDTGASTRTSCATASRGR